MGPREDDDRQGQSITTTALTNYLRSIIHYKLDQCNLSYHPPENAHHGSPYFVYLMWRCPLWSHPRTWLGTNFHTAITKYCKGYKLHNNRHKNADQLGSARRKKISTIHAFSVLSAVLTHTASELCAVPLRHSSLGTRAMPLPNRSDARLALRCYFLLFLRQNRVHAAAFRTARKSECLGNIASRDEAARRWTFVNLERPSEAPFG